MSSDDYQPPEYMIEISERYDSGETVKEILEDPQFEGVGKSTVYYHFRKMNVETGASGPKKSSQAQKTVQKIEVQAIADEAEKIGNLAITLGGIIVRRHLPLLDRLMSSGDGMTVEQIAERIMDWYLSKQATQKQLEDYEIQINRLYEQLEYAYGLSLPNFKYELRTKLLWKYAQQLMKARMMGVRLPVKQTLKAFHNDLITLELEIADIIVIDQPGEMNIAA